MSRKLNEQKFCGWCGSRVAYEAVWQSVCDQCGYVKYFSPSPSCNVLVTHDDAVLMLQRAMEPNKDKFDFPGGFMDMTDDSLETNIYRELSEELGITKQDLSPPVYLGSRVSLYVLHDTAHEALNCYFRCRLLVKTSSLNIDRTESSKLRWVRSADVSDIDFALEPDKTMLINHFGGK